MIHEDTEMLIPIETNLQQGDDCLELKENPPSLKLRSQATNTSSSSTPAPSELNISVTIGVLENPLPPPATNDDTAKS